MKQLSVQTFRELLYVMKNIFRAVWGTNGIEGLSGSQFAVMINLYRHGPLSPSDLSDRMLVTRGNITGLIERLRKSGWVERRRSSTDRRVLKIALSKSGLAKLESVIPTWEEAVFNSFHGLKKSELQALFTLTKKLHKSFPGFSAHPHKHGEPPPEK